MKKLTPLLIGVILDNTSNLNIIRDIFFSNVRDIREEKANFMGILDIFS